MSITIADLKKVYKTTFEARNEWKNILLELEVSSAIIRSIGESCHDNPKDCYREGLSKWLESGERSWGELVESLSSPTVGHYDIAMVLRRNCIQSVDTTAIVIPERQTADITSSNPHHQKINKRLTIFSDKKIGSGAFGVVFEGSYRSRPCAVKVLHELATQMRSNLPAGQKNNETIKSFERECEFLESFQHPNIVQHLSTDEHPMSGSTILVTELMDCNLRSYLSGLGGKSLASHCQVTLSKDVASGLAYIHSRKIIHRDLCGDNILIRLHPILPVAKISDFGMSRLLDPSQMSSTLTAVGHRMGYLPPEALRLEDEEYDYSLDVFSFGVIMVQIVCEVKTIKTVKDRSFLVSQIPTTHRLNLVISTCLQEDKRKRPTARDICTMIKREVTIEEINKLAMVPSRNQRGGSSTPVRGRPLGMDNPQAKSRSPLTLKWRKGKEMPNKMGTTVQSVVIEDFVYVSGGLSSNNPDSCTVMKLNLQQDEWTKLPQYSCKYFAMTSLANQLVLVGGVDPVTWEPINQIALFSSEKWINPYPSMNIARRSSTAVCFNDCIIVAGGINQVDTATSSVEVLDVKARRWYFAESLPNVRTELKSTVVGNTLYIMGGRDHTGWSTKVVHKVDLNELITKAISNQATPTLWQSIEDSPFEFPAFLNIEGSLLAVGGRDNWANPSSSIHLFQLSTREWVKVGDLPTARYNCTCSVLPTGEVIVAGGQTSVLLNSSVLLISYASPMTKHYTRSRSVIRE